MAASAVDAFRSSLLAMADSGRRAVPNLGEDLNRRLAEIEASLGPAAEPEQVTTAARETEAELSVWADKASDHHAENEREMKEIIAALARTGDALSTRDRKYSMEIGGLSGKLKNIATLSNLGIIRRSIMESATALKTCVERMAEENQQAVQQLSAQVKEYRERLEASERLSSTDPLTELANRRAFERHLQARISDGKPFGLIMIDLNDFKQVNDQHGHLAGDELLRQFAGELRAHFSATDVVARWGGDEFAVLVAGAMGNAEERETRIRRWALGEYRIVAGEKTIRTSVTASTGTVEWDGVESGKDLLARADALVYRTKQRTR